ncbi:MAG: Fn3-like domain-containing protein [Lachnospiraceae bacterium]|nr:Fn3-like domain-containing protein [Lachnospiraceae bacterium]
MSTSEPLYESEGVYYSVLKQGSGLANIGNAVTAKSYILMGDDATDSASDGKIKAELGDDPDREGSYTFSFTIHNFSDEDLDYTLSGDMFTQDTYESDGVEYLSQDVLALAADISFTVDGEAVDTESAADCDLDLDGDTDTNDAQMILNYLTGLADSIDAYTADVDEDGTVTTYDAYLILCGLASSTVTVAAGETAQVVVTITCGDSVKEMLNETYVNGAYLEGYIYVAPAATDEGEITDSVHSIPVLGFYGNWSDPSMYEPTTYAEYLYDFDGTAKANYSGVASANTLVYQPADDSQYAYYYVGNP